MTSRQCLVCMAIVCGLLGASIESAGQPLGSFRWQMAPFCNVITLAVTASGPLFRLDGSDDLCGSATRAAVVGTAVPNTDGTIALGFTIVAAPEATPSHVNVTLNVAALGGPWRDSGGNDGAFIFNPVVPFGSPRPTGLGAAAIDGAQVQRRVVGSCGSGQFLNGVNQDGTVSCGSGSGTITGVAAGAGLTGGGVTGGVALAVNFGGTGAASAAARSDHTHAAAPFASTQVGTSALATVTTGDENTAIGSEALQANTTGERNTALGRAALRANVSGEANVALGNFALANNTSNINTAVGYIAMGLNTIGSANTAIGAAALHDSVAGSNNVAVGANALVKAQGGNNISIGTGIGDDLVNGSNNTYIGADGGLAAEANATYIRGISGNTSSGGSAVFINGAGKLGTLTSSIRFKEDVEPIGDVSRLLSSLRPVMFHYKSEVDDGQRLKQYGLIAEEVAEVWPELVVRDGTGKVESVRYHFLVPLLLTETKRLERERKAQDERVAAMAEELAHLRRLVERLTK